MHLFSSSSVNSTPVFSSCFLLLMVHNNPITKLPCPLFKNGFFVSSVIMCYLFLWFDRKKKGRVKLVSMRQL